MYDHYINNLRLIELVHKQSCQWNYNLYINRIGIYVVSV